MSFEVYENSRSLGAPINLFLFIYGDGPDSFLAYTNGDTPVVFEGRTYVPIAVQRGKINSSGTLDKSTLSLRFQRDAEIGTLFTAFPPSKIVTLIVREGHADDPASEFLVVWSGRVLSVGREGNEAVVSGEPVSSSMRRPGLRRNYQIGCARALYQPGCNANEAAATVTRTIEAVDEPNITLPSGWNPHPTAKYLGGKVKWTTADGDVEVRKILKIASARVLTLSGHLGGLAVGQSVSVVLGCAHNQDDCLNLHNNIHNYGGCDWIPTKNPVGFDNQYY